MNRATQLYSLFQKAMSWKKYWPLIAETLPELVKEYDFSRIFFSEPYTVVLEGEEPHEREEVYVFPYDEQDYFWFLHRLSKEGVIDRREYHSFLQKLPAKEFNKVLGEVSRLQLDARIYPIKITVSSFLDEILAVTLTSATEDRLLRVSKNKVVAERLFLLALKSKDTEVLQLLRDRISFTDELIVAAIRSVGDDFALLHYLPVNGQKLMEEALYISPQAVNAVARFLDSSSTGSPRDLFFFWYEHLQQREREIDEETARAKARKNKNKAKGRYEVYSYPIFNSNAYLNLFKGFLASGLVPLYLLIETSLASDEWRLQKWAQKQQARNLENV